MVALYSSIGCPSSIPASFQKIEGPGTILIHHPFRKIAIIAIKGDL